MALEEKHDIISIMRIRYVLAAIVKVGIRLVFRRKRQNCVMMRESAGICVESCQKNFHFHR
jgi:hypothetical protein